MKVEAIRKRCFGICQERFGNAKDTRKSLTKEGIREILRPFKDVDWHSLKADSPYQTAPGEVEMKIADTGEKAAQRAILRQGETDDIHGSRIRWIDAEVPVCPGGNPRRRCVDLLGARLIGKPRYQNPLEIRRLRIVELKFTTAAGQLSDSPPCAIFEALAYGASLYANRVSNGGDLWGHRHLALDATTFPDVYVAANRSYWRAWGNVLGDNARYLWLLQYALRDLLAPAFGPHRRPVFNWAVFPDIDFARQKGGKRVYEPRIPARTRGWDSLWSRSSDLGGYKLGLRRPYTDIWEAM